MRMSGEGERVHRSYWESLSLRVCFVILFAILTLLFLPFGLSIQMSLVCGASIGTAAVLLEMRVTRANLSSLIAAAAGLFIGGGLGLIFVAVLRPGPVAGARTIQFLEIAVPALGGYVGLVAGIRKSHLFDVTSLPFISRDAEPSSIEKILDTSILIDGRISDIAESGFLEGRFVIPQFVLNELQAIADSQDGIRRNRGRRGLDIVQRLQSTPGVHVEVSTVDFPAVKEVDLKLIELAKVKRSKIVTNDFNLNKLAQVQGVNVLNVNQLASAVKPVVLPGETMRVVISKEGKEPNQGVAYLDDGTMVVVDNARRLISRTIDITVTSVLQTTAGKMIFGKHDERLHAAERSAAAVASATGTTSG